MFTRIARIANRASGGRLAYSTLLRTLYRRVHARGHTAAHRDRMLEHRHVNGIEILIDPRKTHQRAVANGHDTAAKHWVHSQFAAHDHVTVYDFGANIGSWTLNLATHLPDPSVISVEPEPVTHEQLATNIALNDLEDRVTTINGVVTDTPGDRRLHVSASANQATHSLTPSSHHGAEHTTVTAYTGDQLTATHPAPDFIKIDVEGAEAHVLAGLTQTLETHAPTLVIDIHSSELDNLASPDAVDEFLTRLSDYGTTRVIRDGTPERVDVTTVQRPACVLVTPTPS